MSWTNAPDAGRPLRDTRGDSFKHEVEVLQPTTEYDQALAEIDIVAVPGLGAHPHNSWKAHNSDFNWLSSGDKGLIRTFPKARILLYNHLSKWIGNMHVDQTIGSLASSLLLGLRAHRQGCERRPIIFIGHSMGGLIIAKAINLAVVRGEEFPSLFRATVACLFFGTPFQGASVALPALLFAEAFQDYGFATRSKLLDLMMPNSDHVSEIRRDFLSNIAQGSYKIDVTCYWEEKQTTLSHLTGSDIGVLNTLFDITVPRSWKQFVSRESASLDTARENFGLARVHRDLVKFDGPDDADYVNLLAWLKDIVHQSRVLVKKRFASLRAVDPSIFHSLRGVLGAGTYPKLRLQELRQGLTTRSWISTEADYVQWQDRNLTHNDSLWICGPEGTGKTSATVTAIESIDKLIDTARRNDDQLQSGTITQAYFFCDATPEGSSVEALLKSLIWQLIEEQESLAVYAKDFVDDSQKYNVLGRHSTWKRTLSTENLWQCLQDMLNDDELDMVYFTIHNLHMLPEGDPAVQRLMICLVAELDSFATHQRHARCRLLFTSRNRPHLERAFTQRTPIYPAAGYNGANMPQVQPVRKIDLTSEKYQNQLGLNLRQHAISRIKQLGKTKKYDRALEYFAGATLGERAENTIWIDIAVMRLAALPAASTTFQVRKMLVDDIPQELDALLDLMWMTVFDRVADKEKLRELLRALILTFEEPSPAELAMLTGLPSLDQPNDELWTLLTACEPLLIVAREGQGAARVRFANREVKTHLERRCETMLGLSKRVISWQHGYLALRCFVHVLSKFHHTPMKPNNLATQFAKDTFGEALAVMERESKVIHIPGQSFGNGSETIHCEHDEEVEVGDLEHAATERVDVLSYAVKHWLNHAGKATLDIAESLSLEHDFWASGSRTRLDWLIEYNRLTNIMNDWPLASLTGLHVAASLGFAGLVRALLKNGYSHEMNVTDKLHYTPLHLAAWFGQAETVDELLRGGSAVDYGTSGGHDSPLHMATHQGGIQVMEKLIARGADINAISSSMGPVINAAILSGNQQGAEMLIKRGANLDVEMIEIYSPLALSARTSDLAVFRSLLDAVKGSLPVKQYDDALVVASEAGRLEILGMLTNSEYAPSVGCYQRAFDGAATKGNWHIVRRILESFPRHLRLDCNKAFYAAASDHHNYDEQLDILWNYSDGNVSTSTLDDSLFAASDNEKLKTVQCLLRYGANPNATGEIYGDALTAAAFDGSVEIVKALMEKDVDVNGPQGWALQAAAKTKDERHMHIAALLLVRHADVNAFTTSDQVPQGTALQVACEASWVNMVQLLLNNGADPNRGAGTLTTPLIAASWNGDPRIVGLLLDHGADVHLRDATRRTALIAGADYLPQLSLAALLDRGADINATDLNGNTALIVAAMASKTYNVKLLIERGADIMHVNKDGKNAVMVAFDSEFVNNESYVTDIVPAAVQNGTLNEGASKQDGYEELNYNLVRQVTTTKRNKRATGILPENQDTCFHILQSQLYKLMSILKQAVDGGDRSAVRIAREAGLAVPKLVNHRTSSLPVRSAKSTEEYRGMNLSMEPADMEETGKGKMESTLHRHAEESELGFDGGGWIDPPGTEDGQPLDDGLLE